MSLFPFLLFFLWTTPMYAQGLFFCALWDHSWQGSEDHVLCWELKPGQLHAKQCTGSPHHILIIKIIQVIFIHTGEKDSWKPAVGNFRGFFRGYWFINANNWNSSSSSYFNLLVKNSRFLKECFINIWSVNFLSFLLYFLLLLQKCFYKCWFKFWKASLNHYVLFSFIFISLEGSAQEAWGPLQQFFQLRRSWGAWGMNSSAELGGLSRAVPKKNHGWLYAVHAP